MGGGAAHKDQGRGWKVPGADAFVRGRERPDRHPAARRSEALHPDRKVGIRIIRVAHEAADLKVLAVPAACPMRWSTEG